MNDARPTLPNSRNLGTKSDAVASDGAGLSHARWLASLTTGDDVMIRNGALVFRSAITDDTPKFLFIGKLKYNRATGWLTTRLQARAYRFKLRLVRSEKDMQ